MSFYMSGPEDRTFDGHGDQARISRPAHNFRGWVTGAMVVSMPAMLTYDIAPMVSSGLFGIAGAMVVAGALLRAQSRRVRNRHFGVSRNAVARPVSYPTTLPAGSYWQTHSSQHSNAVAMRVALVGARSKRLNEFAERLAQLGCDVHQSDDPDAILGAMENNPDGWAAVIVDLPSHNDVDAFVADIRDFASAMPGLPLIALDGSTRPRLSATLYNNQIIHNTALDTEMDDLALLQVLRRPIGSQYNALPATWNSAQ